MFDGERQGKLKVTKIMAASQYDDDVDANTDTNDDEEEQQVNVEDAEG